MSSIEGGLFQAKLWLLHVPSPHGNPCWGSTACLEDSDPETPSASGALSVHALPDALLMGTPAQTAHHVQLLWYMKARLAPSPGPD